MRRRLNREIVGLAPPGGAIATAGARAPAVAPVDADAAEAAESAAGALADIEPGAKLVAATQEAATGKRKE